MRLQATIENRWMKQRVVTPTCARMRQSFGLAAPASKFSTRPLPGVIDGSAFILHPSAFTLA
jgi:hypothetical protein